MTPQTQRDGKRKGHWDTGRDYERETGILRETTRVRRTGTDGQAEDTLVATGYVLRTGMGSTSIP